MAILTPEERDIITENSFALAVLANYVRTKHGTIRLSCAVADVATVVEPNLAVEVVDLAARRECTRVAVEITGDRVFTEFELAQVNHDDE